MPRTLKIIIPLIWAYEVAYGIAKWILGEYIHPATFALAALAVLLTCIQRLAEEELMRIAKLDQEEE